MAKTLTVSPVRASINFTHTNSTTLGADVSLTSSYTYSKSFSDGTGANAANRLYAEVLTISASSTSNLDLAGGVTDVFGAAITFTKVKVIYLEATSTLAGGPVKVGGHATAALANWIGSADTLDNDQPFVRLRAPGVFLLACSDATGYAVTATTEDILSLVNESGSVGVEVKVAIVGEG